MLVLNEKISDRYSLYQGDCVEVLKGIPDNSIPFSIFSPPFSSLYVYSNSERDMGNSTSDEEFYRHFRYLVDELYRVTQAGRLLAFHCMNFPMKKSIDGVIGIKDFRGELIRMFTDAGFIYHSEICIWKNPVSEMQRTKALGLLHKQLRKDSSMCRQGLPDYVVVMRKPGVNLDPIDHTHETFPVRVWQRYASPVWMDIRQSETLQRKSARDEKDERHVCLAEGTLILTKRGYIPIEEIIPNIDEVLTHKGRWRKVISKALTQENADIIQVQAIGVPYLLCTPDHKLYAKTWVKERPKDNLHKVKPEWVEAHKVSNSYLGCALPPEEESDISDQEWWIIGRWLADGHVDVRGRQYFISVGNSKLEQFKEKAAEKIGIVTPRSTNCTQIGLKGLSNSARNILKKCGKGAKNKVLPYEMISLNSTKSRALLDGYLSGDGCFLENGHIVGTSVSRPLLLGLALVAQRLDQVMSIREGREERTTRIEGRLVHCQKEWVFNISPHYSFNLIEEKFEWKKVKRLKDKEKANVWSIQVDEDASYTAEGCIVKNCPLQLEVIKRCIELWTNPDEIVLDPFAGIGSTNYMALRLGRKTVGIELKDSYYTQAVNNCEMALKEPRIKDLDELPTQLELFSQEGEETKC